jgi:hypothetical protein
MSSSIMALFLGQQDEQCDEVVIQFTPEALMQSRHKSTNAKAPMTKMKRIMELYP